MIRSLSLIAVIALGTAGCIDQVVESRVKSALVGAGVSNKNADCMAGRMVDRLSISQLRTLEQLKPRDTESDNSVGLRSYVERVRKVADAETIGVTASSAALCATGLG